jgi:hypothetical protein
MGDWAPQEARNVVSDLGPRKLFLWRIPVDRKEIGE